MPKSWGKRSRVLKRSRMLQIFGNANAPVNKKNNSKIQTKSGMIPLTFFRIQLHCFRILSPNIHYPIFCWLDTPRLLTFDLINLKQHTLLRFCLKTESTQVQLTSHKIRGCYRINKFLL